MDAGNLLKPALARGELHAIGATTVNEYRKHIEKDPALERRFQPVFVGEPSVEDTVSILRGLKERYEVHHKVRIQDAALVDAARLSNRYITDRFLPDKAIDLVDEASSRLRIEIDSMPTEVDEIRRRIAQLEIEKQGLKKEKDDASRRRLGDVEKEIAGLNETFAGLKARWDREKGLIQKLSTLRADLETVKTEQADAERKADFNKAAEVKFGRLPAIQAEIDKVAEGARRGPEGRRHAAGGGHPRGDRRGGLQVDRHPGLEAHGGAEGEAALHGEAAGRAGRRPGAGGAGGVGGGAALPLRHAGSQPSHRLLHLPGPHRRGKDRDRPRAGRVPLRRRRRHDPHRHVRVRGEALRLPAHRRAPRLRGVRGGRAAHRGGATPPLRGGALRRDREGPPRRLQRLPPDPRRRTAHRRAGAHGRLPQRRAHHDLQRRLRPHHAAGGPPGRRPGDARRGHGGACAPSSSPSS